MPKMDGHVRGYIRTYTRQDGKTSYRAVVRYPDPDRPGQWLERTKVFHVRYEAQAWRAATIAEHAKNPQYRPQEQTVGGLLDRWLTTVARTRVRPSTLDTYTAKAKLAADRIGHIPLARLRPLDIQNVYGDLLTCGKAPATVQGVHMVVHAALATAVEWGWLLANPADRVKPPRIPSREITPPTPDQAAQLLRTAEPHRLYALWVFLALTGVRKGEALALQWGDIDETERVAHIRRTLTGDGRGRAFGPPKTASARRDVALSHALITVLQAHRTRQDAERLAAGPRWIDMGLAFTTSLGTWLGPSNIHRVFKQLVAQAALPPSTRIHDLRHALATRWLADGVQPRTVSEQLGHAGVGVTLAIYGHVVPAMRTQAADQDAQSLLTGVESEPS